MWEFKRHGFLCRYIFSGVLSSEFLSSSRKLRTHAIIRNMCCTSITDMVVSKIGLVLFLKSWDTRRCQFANSSTFARSYYIVFMLQFPSFWTLSYYIVFLSQTKSLAWFRAYNAPERILLARTNQIWSVCLLTLIS